MLVALREKLLQVVKLSGPKLDIFFNYVPTCFGIISMQLISIR